MSLLGFVERTESPNSIDNMQSWSLIAAALICNQYGSSQFGDKDDSSLSYKELMALTWPTYPIIVTLYRKDKCIQFLRIRVSDMNENFGYHNIIPMA